MRMRATTLSLLTACLLPVLPAHAGDCPDTESRSAAQLTAEATPLLSQLAAPLDQAESGLISGYLHKAGASSRSQDYVLRNYARVALAATQLREARYDSARQTLSQVELDSPAAVRAALLLAESYRMQGQHPTAASWMLRIAERYSSDPEALSGLLLAAEDAARRGDIATALAVYSRVLEKSLANLDEIRDLNGNRDALYQVILEGRIDNTRAVSSEVIQRTLGDPESDSLHHFARLKGMDDQLACLRKEAESHRETSFSASLGNAQDSAFLVMLENEKALTQTDIRAAEQALATASPYDDRAQLEARLSEARQALDTINTRLAEIGRSAAAGQEKNAEALARLEAQIASLEHEQATARAAINSSLEKVLNRLLGDYREMAGEAQLGRAEMKQLFSRVGAN